MYKFLVFLSDFGLEDGFVGIVKGEILKRNENINIIDLTHNIPSQDVFFSYLILRRSIGHFPSGTLFLSIVDPEVGSERKIVYLKSKEFGILMPDNGCLPLLLKDEFLKISDYEIFTVTLKEHEQIPSNTFHGRDIFAPIAAYLTLDKFNKLNLISTNLNELKSVGFSLITNKLNMDNNQIKAKVIYIDHFGNCYLNITKKFLNLVPNNVLKFKELQIPIKKNYSEVEEGEVVCVVNSDGFLELAINKGNFANTFNIQKYEEIILSI